MTMLNIWAGHDRALVASESLLYSSDGTLRRLPDGTVSQRSKLHVLPLAHAVFASAGGGAVPEQLYHRLTGMLSIEAVAEALPDLLHGMALPLVRDFPRDTVAVVGWSARQQCMVMVTAESEDSFAATHMDVQALGHGQQRGLLLPHVRVDWSDEPTTPEAMLRLARRQVAEHAGGRIPYGGQLHVCEITPRGVSLCIAGDLGMPPCGDAQEGAGAVFGRGVMSG